MNSRLIAFGKYITSIRSRATAERYQVSAQRFLGWLNASGAASIETAPRNALAQYCAALVDAGYLPATVHMHIAGVRRFIRWARMEDIPVPDFHPPELPRQTRQIRDALAPELFEKYFALAAELEEPVRTAVMLLPCTGLRGMEMVTLPLGCMKRSKITLRDGTEKDVLMFRVTGKGGHERWVPLLDEGAQMVAGYLRGWRREHTDARWLFPGRKDHMSDRTLRAALQHIRTPLGMRFTPHTMRRTYLTQLYRNGLDVGYLAKIAGHTDTKTLLTHYLAIDDVDIAKAVHETGGSLKGPTPT